MTMTPESAQHEINDAIGAVREVVASAAEPLYAGQVMERLRRAKGYDSEVTRHAIWRLISQKELHLTTDRKLESADPAGEGVDAMQRAAS